MIRVFAGASEPYPIFGSWARDCVLGTVLWQVQLSYRKTVPSGTSTELEGNTCNRCRTRTARTEMHFDEDARPDKIKDLRLWIWKQNYVKRVHHLSIMRVDPVRASYARHQVCRRIEYQC